MKRFEGEGAAVTGGASGIGEATVWRFVEDGARVSFADRDAARGRQVAAETEAQDAVARFVEADVGGATPSSTSASKPLRRSIFS